MSSPAAVPDSEDETGTGRPCGTSSRRSRIRYRLLRFLIVLAVYVLSIGPMFWVWYESEYLGRWPLVRLFYAPLRLICYPKFVEDWLNRYIEWWIT